MKRSLLSQICSGVALGILVATALIFWALPVLIVRGVLAVIRDRK